MMIANGSKYAGFAFILEIDDKIIPRVIYYSCTGTTEYKIDKYWLKLNKESYNTGDTITGTVYLKTKPMSDITDKIIVVNGRFNIKVVD